MIFESENPLILFGIYSPELPTKMAKTIDENFIVEKESIESLDRKN